MKRMSRHAATMLLCGIASTAQLSAAVYDFAVDVPANLGGTDFTPNQVVRNQAATYGVRLTLPSNVAISAVHVRNDGALLFTPAHAVLLGGVEYEPRDVVLFDGTNYSYALHGSTVGISDGTRIDSIFLDATNLVVSFNAPTQLGGVDYLPSSLVKWAGSFSLYWDGPAAGVPAASNLVGADRTPDGALILSFDIPTSLGGTDYLQGQLVRWKDAAFSLYASDAAWPPYAQLRDFSLLPAAGDVPGASLKVSKHGPTALTLMWTPSCSASDTDFEVYEGALSGPFASHAPRLCTTGGATTVTLTPNSGNRYFLVVPHNAVSEGSYGTGNGGNERPVAAEACLPQQTGACL